MRNNTLIKNERIHNPNCVKFSLSIPSTTLDEAKANAKRNGESLSYYISSAVEVANNIEATDTMELGVSGDMGEGEIDAVGLEALMHDVDTEIVRLQKARYEMEAELAKLKSMVVA